VAPRCCAPGSYAPGRSAAPLRLAPVGVYHVHTNHFPSIPAIGADYHWCGDLRMRFSAARRRQYDDIHADKRIVLRRRDDSASAHVRRRRPFAAASLGGRSASRQLCADHGRSARLRTGYCTIFPARAQNWRKENRTQGWQAATILADAAMAVRARRVAEAPTATSSVCRRWIFLH
jgi:hypothetical protein